MKVTITENIHAPRDDVFRLFRDFEHMAQNLTGVTKVEFIEGDPASPAPGLAWRETREFLGKEATEKMWLSTIDAPISYTVESDEYGTKYESSFTFKEQDNGTTVTMTFGGKAVSLKAKLMYPLSFLFLPATKKMLRQDLLDLKLILESRMTAEQFKLRR